MKKGLIIAAIISATFTACSDNKTSGTETTVTNDTLPVTTEVASTMAPADTTNADSLKRVKDSTDAAHGHTH